VNTVPDHAIVSIWMASNVFFALVGSLLVWAGILILDAIRPYIQDQQKIGESGISIGLFIGGFFSLIPARGVSSRNLSLVHQSKNVLRTE